MRLLSAGALWWLAIGAIIIFFYLLKLKRNRRVVPSVWLWRRAMEEIEANAPFKKLRRNLLLLLQLIALAAIVFALARPLVTTSALASGNTIIIVDSTASMGAIDEDNRSRLDRARAIAREMVEGIGREDRAAIIESSSRVTVRAALTSDRAALRSAIGDIQQTDAAGNLTDAVRLAEQIAKTERDANIAIISDGGGGLESESASPRAVGQPGAAAPPSISLRFIRVGTRAENVGIVAMNSRPAREGEREMFASIANFGATDRAVGVELRVDGKLVDARSVSVGANGRSGLVFDALPRVGGLAELKIAAEDDLAADNIAYTFLPDARRTRVGVASANPFLLEAIAANPDIDARRISAGANATEFDCVVSDGADFLAGGRPLLLINPPDGELWRGTGQIEHPEITAVDRSHPVNNFLSYADLHVESATRREAAAFMRPIVTSGDAALIWAGDDGRRRVVVIGFDLAKSDLPLKVEFPILLANSIAWLGGRDADGADRAIRAGQPVTIRTAAPTVTITTPAGDSREIASRAGVAGFADTARVGAYEVKDAPSFAVSLLAESESNTTPKDSVRTRAGEITGEAQGFKSEREAWRWIAIAALFFLTVEWLVYHRRIA